MGSPTDEILMQQVRGGDVRQLAILFERHHLGLFSYYLRMTGDRAFWCDGDKVVLELSGGTPSANLLTGFGLDETFARSDAGGLFSLIVDGTNSTLALLDAAGATSTRYTYEPFGKTTASGSASVNTIQFTGRENDGTGLYYYRARLYHPGLQRFISEDPVGFAGGDVNLYAYVRNSPRNFTDPSGNYFVTLPIVIVGGVVIGSAGWLEA